MVDPQLHDRIEKYLLGELPAEENTRLETEMENNPVLLEQVEIQRLGLMGLQRLAAADLIEKFDQWDKDLDEPTPPTASPPIQSKPNRWIWTTTALLLLLIAGAFWHFWQLGKVQQSQGSENRGIAQRDSVVAAMRTEFQQIQDSLSALLSLPRDSFSVLEIKRLREEIDLKDRMLRDLESQRRAGKPQIAMQFAPSPNTATRGGDEGTDPTLTSEKKAFDAKDFTESIRLLKSIPANDPRQAEVTQRLPYSLFYEKDFQAAIPAFLDLLEADQFEEMNVQWHLLLCYVAVGEKSETRFLIHTILKNPKHKYHQKAVDLKKALNI